MDLQTCLNNMISPGMKRPTAYKNGIIQVLWCRSCDLACFGCTQNSQLRGKAYNITPDQFRIALSSLQNHFGVVGAFGGNACLHPKFEELCSILREMIPFERRGLWSNFLNGHGKICRETFNPAVSNLNVHLSVQAYEEMKRDWPECNPVGLETDSRHAPPWISMVDVGVSENERWELISQCDINKYWSAMITVVGEKVSGFFCELAGAAALKHQDDPGFVNTGIDVEANPEWWKLGMNDFREQVTTHCIHCSVPLKIKGELAVGGKTELISKYHAEQFTPKDKNREVKVVDNVDDLYQIKHVTSYLKNV